jgi:hypothetical protein
MKCILGLVVAGSVVAANAEGTFPLRVDIDVSTKRTTKNLGAGKDGEAKIEQVQLRVKVRKSSGQPYAETLSAELYVIGKEVHTGLIGIIDAVKKDFTFTKDNDNTFEFTSGQYSMPRTQGNIDAGGVYETYLLVVVDKDGKIVDSRSGRAIRQQGIDFIRKLGPKTLFDRDGNVIGEVEHPGRAFRKALPAAVDPGDDD